MIDDITCVIVYFDESLIQASIKHTREGGSSQPPHHTSGEAELLNPKLKAVPPSY